MITKQYLNESTSDLLQYINWREDPDYKEAAQQAFIVICYKFREVLTKKCEVIAKGKGLGNSDVIEIVENTFKRLYKYSKSFDPTRHIDVDKGLKYYLFSIGRTLNP